MTKNELVAPVLKWVGGKRQLLSVLIPLLPKTIDVYCEPFLGGGALLFSLQPEKAIINDINKDLIIMYNVIKNDVDLLIKELQKHKNESDYFYEIRNWDRDKTFYNNLTDIQKASRIIYLNKTCFNGLFRVNSSGQFNVPFGNYKNPNIINTETLKAVNSYFKDSKIKILNVNYDNILTNISNRTFVYLDPPYDPISNTSNFTNYSSVGFFKDDQIKLKNHCDNLTKKNIKFMLSNSSTDFIKELYKDYNITIVQAKRSINSNSSKRGNIDEVIIRNYG